MSTGHLGAGSKKEIKMKSLLIAGVLLSTSVYSAEYIVKLKDNAKMSKSLKSLGEFEALNLSFGEFQKLTSDQKVNMKTISELPEVEYIEPNYTYTKMNDIQDDNFKKQWGLENDGKNSGGFYSRGVAGKDVSAKKAWKIARGNHALKIAVIDTGVDYTHNDLKSNIMVNEAELNGTDGVDDDGNGYVDDVYGYDFANGDADPMDDHGHGTHCAGVIGASHDKTGIRGVMGKVKILSLKFLKKSGGGTLDGALKSIDYATQRGVDIMSNSWGGGGRSQALFEAIERAQKAGILFVAAAGNSNSDNDKKATFPANYQLDNVMSVGAMDGKGKRASFSNYGKTTVHVFAPGVKIYSTVQGNKYKNMSGTSMACPHVSGVAGLVWSNEPNLTYLELKERLMSTAVKSSELDNFTISGYADAYKALLNQQ